MIVRLIIVSIVFCLVLAALAPARSRLAEEWQKQNVLVRMKAQEANLMDRAEDLAKLAKNDERRLQGAEELAGLYAEGLQYAPAAKALKKVLTNRSMGKTYNENQVRTMLALAEIYRDAGLFGKAEEAYKKLLDYDKFYLPKDDPRVARDLNNLGAICYMIAMITPDKLERELELARAQSFLTQARLCYRKKSSAQSQDDANTLDNEYLVLREQGSQAAAQQAKRQAARVHAHIPGRLVPP
jgi:tetratricopeptide (TPR) repeat protein